MQSWLWSQLITPRGFFGTRTKPGGGLFWVLGFRTFWFQNLALFTFLKPKLYMFPSRTASHLFNLSSVFIIFLYCLFLQLIKKVFHLFISQNFNTFVLFLIKSKAAFIVITFFFRLYFLSLVDTTRRCFRLRHAILYGC